LETPIREIPRAFLLPFGERGTRGPKMAKREILQKTERGTPKEIKNHPGPGGFRESENKFPPG